jgi:hypothetical protein
MTHTHPCYRCKARVPCSAPFERNYDGMPDPVCSAFATGTYLDWECEDCAPVSAGPGWCANCGERPRTDGDYCAGCAPEMAHV